MIRGRHRNVSREKEKKKKKGRLGKGPGVCCCIYFPSLPFLSPFLHFLLTVFPKTKEYKAANTFTTHWRRQAELEGLHYLVTVETGISLNETGVSIPPGSPCGGLQQSHHSFCLSHTSSSPLRSISRSRSPPSFIYYLSTHRLDFLGPRTAHGARGAVTV